MNFITRCSSALSPSQPSFRISRNAVAHSDHISFRGALRHIPKDSCEGDYQVPGIERLFGQLGRALLAVALVEG